MNLTSWVDPRVSGVTVNQVRDYLRNHGWKEEPYPRPELLVFGGKDDDDGLPIILTLPAAERMSDYQMRLVEPIGALGILENRYAVEILNEMLQITESNGTPPGVTNQVQPVGK